MRKFFKLFITLFILSCANSNSQKAGKDPVIPPKHSAVKPVKTITNRPAKVVWVEVNTGNDFWRSLKSSDKNVALIGTEICPPCKLAKAWWEERMVPPGWQFVYWQLNGANDYLTRSFKQIFLDLEQRDNLTLPYLSIIEGINNPAREKKITETFRSLDGCTVGANKFLLMHPQGTIRF